MTTTETPSGGSRIGPPPPMDPELAATLASFAVALPPVTAEMIPLMRRPNPAAPTDDDLARGGAFRVEERAVPGPEGAPEVRLLLCRPTAPTVPVPALYYMHGGGMIIGDNRMAIDEVLDWAQDLGLAVVSVEYRLAPETRHPGPVEDCYAGLMWTLAHAADLGIDPDRVVLAGLSAGGGLAAALALMVRDRGTAAPAGQMLLSPMLDDRNDTPSAFQMEGHGVWDRVSNDTGWTALLGDDRGTAHVSPYAAPARASDLSGLPPTFLDVGSAETFRDEDVAYATRLWAAGGQAELHVWPGCFHGFDTIAPQAQISQEARAARLRWLRRLLAP